MARLKNKTTGIVINVADEKAARYENQPDWELTDDAAPAKPKEPTVDELKAEIDRRNEDREDDAKLSKDGKKADLVATLAADDAAQAQG